MSTVLVTGGSGFIGSWCVVALLKAGYDVRTTVRDLKKEPSLRKQIHGAVKFDDKRLVVCKADLGSDDGWVAAVKGCEYVLHVASPTLRNGPQSEESMVKTARDGVLRVLRVARDSGVRRVVLTSAFGAVGYGYPVQTRPFSEEDWTNVDANIPPYQKSKTLAERAAWDFVKTDGTKLELAVVNPTAVIGPMLGPDNPPSLRIIRSMLSGEVPVCAPFGTGLVDVRDVADLHLRAMTDPKAVGERFLAIAGHSLRVIEVARILRERLGVKANKVPKRELPVAIAYFVGYFNPQLRSIRPQLGQTFDATSAKAERMLGWKARPVEDSIVETAESILAQNVL